MTIIDELEPVEVEESSEASSVSSAQLSSPTFVTAACSASPSTDHVGQDGRDLIDATRQLDLTRPRLEKLHGSEREIGEYVPIAGGEAVLRSRGRELHLCECAQRRQWDIEQSIWRLAMFLNLKARPHAPSPTVVDALAGLEAVAIRGMQHPTDLSPVEISKMCRLAFVAVTQFSPQRSGMCAKTY